MPEEKYSKGGYEAMLWIRDKDGKEYACPPSLIFHICILP